ncbi:MAG: site-2 protease family protein [Thermoguttaceae bacterium]
MAVFLSILIHELGHALVMRAHGYRPWVTLYGMGGLASYNPGDAHGSRGPTALGQILISMAGPMAGFLLAALIVAPIVALDHVDEFFPYGAGWPWIKPYLIGSKQFTDFLMDMLYINIFWGLVNLLPVYPLDGGHVSREIFLVFNSRDGIRRSLILSIVTSVVLVALALNWDEWYIAVLFGYMGYSGYQTLQAYTHGRRW